jgi:hypothetical protein
MAKIDVFEGKIGVFDGKIGVFEADLIRNRRFWVFLRVKMGVFESFLLAFSHFYI